MDRKLLLFACPRIFLAGVIPAKEDKRYENWQGKGEIGYAVVCTNTEELVS